MCFKISRKNPRKKTNKSKHMHVQEGTEVKGKPYNQEIMKVTDLRRGGQKRLKNPFANGSSSSFSGGTKIAPYSKSVDCPESGCEVCFSDCLRCTNFQQWHEKDDGLRRCYHEYLDLDSRGYYDGTWDDHPENFDPETFERIQERKQRNEAFFQEMESEREKLDKMAEELEREEKEIRRSIDSDYDEYLKDEYGDHEDEGEHEEEEEEKDEDENEDDYDEENDKDEDDVEDDYDEGDYCDDDQDDGYDYGDGWGD